MEKLMYLVWKPESQSSEVFREQIRQQLIPALRQQHCQQLRFSVIDDAVSPARKLFIRHTQPSPDALLSFWLPSAITREKAENQLTNHAARFDGYLVTESEPLLNHQHPPLSGKRTHGMNQVVLLRKPAGLAYEDWIDIWHNSHTQIAIATQSTFGYRQNVVTRKLTPHALTIDAIVEENFPPEAMNSAHAFYNALTAGGTRDDELLKKNRAAMFASVQHFVDFQQLDCLPMSEYSFHENGHGNQ